jgi:acyl-CoA synthetase (AMP-forming)/AMP-acid ligase II
LTVGKAGFNVDLRIVDSDGKGLCRGEVGELAVRSLFVCGGYWRRPEDTAASLHQGWWHTGDLARIDDEGFVWVAGRKKDMIISGAENIYPGEVEQVVAELQGVVEVAVVGVPDDDWGEGVAAYVVRQPGSALDEAGIIEHCRCNLASYKKATTRLLYRCATAHRCQQGLEARLARIVRQPGLTQGAQAASPAAWVSANRETISRKSWLVTGSESLTCAIL